jgi:hypothetical protein
MVFEEFTSVNNTNTKKSIKIKKNKLFFVIIYDILFNIAIYQSIILSAFIIIKH